MNLVSSCRTLVLAAVAAALALPAAAQPPHIYGIHDDIPMPTDWINTCPGQTAWITATEAIGTNPSDTGGKVFSAPAGSKILARLNNGYFPNGTIPVPAQFANFATRCANFAAASTGCDTWVIGNETNLAIEWPNDGASNLVYISPADYANCYKQCHAAIKAVRPAHKVLVQAVGPWGGPYGPGNLGGYAHVGQPDNWPDYMHKMLTAITTGAGAVTPDGIATHINSRGYAASALQAGPYVTAGSLTLDFSWGVHRDWVQFGIPRNLWSLPLFGTECNGLFWWKGGGPESAGDPPYQAGWLQGLYASLNTWNQAAAQFAMPLYRCANMYRWGNWDGWTIDAAPSRAAILSDLASAAAGNHQWPAFGGNAVSIATPSGAKITTGITVTADSQYDAGTYAATNAFDGNLATKWTSTSTADTHWIAADLGSPKVVTGLCAAAGQRRR